MKKVHVNEDKCLGCRLCEYWCAFAHSGEKYMPDAFNLTKPPVPRIVVEEKSKVTCRCLPPLRRRDMRKKLYSGRT